MDAKDWNCGGMTIDTSMQLEKFCAGYANKLSDVLGSSDWSGVAQLGLDMYACWTVGRQVFVYGNGVARVMLFTSPTIFCMASPSELGVA